MVFAFASYDVAVHRENSHQVLLAAAFTFETVSVSLAEGVV
jgi:hypothetical protein